MNILYIIIGILVFDFILERILSYLNDKNWSDELPAELSEFYDEEKYKKSQAYSKERNKFGLFSASFSFILMLGMLLFGGFGWLNEQLTPFFSDPIYLALAYFGILIMASDILGTPFSIYSTFVIEEKYGFNKTTAKTFVFDKIKGWLMAIVIGGGILFLILKIIIYFDENFWLYAWIVVVAFSVFFNMFYTTLIVPIFNKLTPLEDGELKNAIEAFAKKVKFPITRISVIDGSKRSSKANAYFSGLGPKKNVVLFDTLVKDYSKEELVAVLAHEVGHYKKKHIIQTLIISIVQTGITFFLLSLFIKNENLSIALGAETSVLHLNLIAFGMLYGPISMLTGLLMNVFSRKNEFEADRYATENYAGDPLKTALSKLHVDTLSNLQPHPAYVFFHYSHPPLLQRLNAISKI